MTVLLDIFKIGMISSVVIGEASNECIDIQVASLLKKRCRGDATYSCNKKVANNKSAYQGKSDIVDMQRILKLKMSKSSGIKIWLCTIQIECRSNALT